MVLTGIAAVANTARAGKPAMIKTSLVLLLTTCICAPGWCRAADPAVSGQPAINDGAKSELTPAQKLQQQRVERAVERALVFLAGEQLPSGAWLVDQYRGGSTAATSLAVMSFLAAGYTPEDEVYGRRITRGIDFVLSSQRADGLLVSSTGHGPMYSHGISTLMLAEVVGMVDEARADRVRAVLAKAIALILKAQDVAKARGHEGGWRYSPQSADADLSVTGWQLLALRAAKDVGCDVPAENVDRAIAYVLRCHTQGGFTYQPGQQATTVRTGTGIVCLEVAGEHHMRQSLAAADYLKLRPLRWTDAHFFYGVYYCSVGMFKIGGKHWESFRDNLTELLLDFQQEDGSWLSRSERRYGAPYCTCMAILGLTVEYRYLPIYQR